MVVVLPPTGGSTYLEHSYSKKLAKRGFYVVRVMGWDKPDETSLDLNIHRKLLTRAQEVVSIIVNDQDFKSYSLLGTSLGALHASISIGQSDKVQTAVLITAGAPLSEVIANSTESGLTRTRNKRFEKFGYKSMTDYEEALKETNIPNALDDKEILRQKEILMVIALKDKTVPTKNQKDLEEAIKPREVITFESGHFWTIMKTWLFNSKDVVSFIKEKSKAQVKAQ
jgi:surfactin synthase thioesterase subunit